MLDRLDARSPRYSFALDAVLVSLGILLMWPRLLWVACRAFWDWLRSEWRTPLFWCSMVLVPLVFWLAPLVVVMRNRSNSGLPMLPPAFWPAVLLAANFGALLFNAAIVWVMLYVDKPVSLLTWLCVAVSLPMAAWMALDLDRAVARVESGEAA